MSPTTSPSMAILSILDRLFVCPNIRWSILQRISATLDAERQRPMPYDFDEASELAKDHACEEYRRSIEIQSSKAPDPLPYGSDLDGCVWFVVVEKSQFRVGGDNYVAVNIETGEAKFFRNIGE